MSTLREKLAALPAKPGVYLFKDRAGTVIYVGKAKSLRRRVASYFKPNPDLKTSILVSRLYDADFITTGSELDALILEEQLVKKYRPRYNIALKDDKAYPYLKLTVNEEWPRLLLVRRREKDGALYFGRFQGGMVRAVVRLVKKLFPIRWCVESPLRSREQPCLYYHIGACAGPCIGRITKEDYRTLIEGLALLLRGKMAGAIAKLQVEMARAAARRDYERAAALRDSIKLIEKMQAGKSTLGRTPTPRGIRELAELQQALNLKKLPMRIECFDISNLQGANMVASLVTFLGGAPLKSDYRRFKIRSVEGKPNDVQAIYEVVKRRYAGSLARKMDDPDLVMVDGGAAQAAFGQKALTEAGRSKLPLIGLAKREEEIYLPGHPKPLHLDRATPGLQLLQRIRDEAHRFAITFHREKRKKSFFA
ncbi:MAG: excinuclease ABC subunit UvrC [Candidatus Margulisbacteria bacterium]|jgi:excinuclease ABC subunit C|nr:excinuclease ABC subunit UvrC [Candidatus Margulisiibacteriota bacterium]